MTVKIEGDQATLTQLLSVIFENTEERQTNNFRQRAVHAQLNDAGKARSTQSKQAGEVQILSDDYGPVGACVV